MLSGIESLKPKNTRDWLMLAAMTGLVLVSPASAAKVVLEFVKEHNKNKTNQKLTSIQVSRAIYDLKKRNVIQFKKEGDRTILILTEKGKKKKLGFDLRNMKPQRPLEWDGKWRMIMFDIPEAKKDAREAFRGKLKAMGFMQFQKSVWTYPYKCEDEIDFISEHFGIAEYIHLLTAKIDDDAPLRAHFKL